MLTHLFTRLLTNMKAVMLVARLIARGDGDDRDGDDRDYDDRDGNGDDNGINDSYDADNVIKW